MRRLPLAALALLVAAPGARADVTPESARGVYRLAGSARVSASPLPAERLELRADAVLRPADGPRRISARLATQGHACELGGGLAPDGSIAFDEGQRCVLELDDPGARGHVEGRLRSGSGRLAGRELSLDLAFDVSGTVSVSAGGVRVPGLGVEVPPSWTPPTPVHGEARATASGTRDDSRAAGR
ncbi:MAG TPA: hypothetical protein VFM45_01740 [Anaeromyxobacteraceae bacterium]|nr:hypothetical protein [Anaeromyxobacteraceae bacterium]